MVSEVIETVGEVGVLSFRTCVSSAIGQYEIRTVWEVSGCDEIVLLLVIHACDRDHYCRE